MSDSIPTAGKSRSVLTKWFRRLVWTLLFLATLVFLFHAVEDWRGVRAWTRTLAELEAGGAVLHPAGSATAPVPDAENIAMHPAFRGFTFTQPGGVRTMRLAGDPVDPADAAVVAQWDAFAQWMGARQSPYRDMVGLLKQENARPHLLTPDMASFLQGLIPHRPLFAQITGALPLPSCQWPDMGSRHQITTAVVAGNGEGPEFSVLRVNNAWRCLAMEALLAGKMDEALRLAGQAGDLYRVLQGQGNLLTFLVMSSLLDSEVEVIGNVLRTGAPPASPCLAAADRFARRPGLFGQYQEVLIRERVWAVAVGSALMDSGELAKMMAGFTTKTSVGIHHKLGQVMTPAGWQKQVLAAQLRLLSERIKAHDPALPPLERIAREMSCVEAARRGFGPYRPLDSWGGDFAVGFLKKDIRRDLMEVALMAAHLKSVTGKAPGSVADFPSELAAKLPASPLDGAAPSISRGSDGTWTVTYPGMERLPGDGAPVVLRLPGW